MNIERDKFLTETMGECWHEWAEDCHDACSAYTRWTCTKCGETDSHADIDVRVYEVKPYQNNFYTWEGFGGLWEWSQKQKWWVNFVIKVDSGDLQGNFCIDDYFPALLIHPDHFADAVYEYLKEGKR